MTGGGMEYRRPGMQGKRSDPRRHRFVPLRIGRPGR
jgi:hypothetical protein